MSEYEVTKSGDNYMVRKPTSFPDIYEKVTAISTAVFAAIKEHEDD